MAQVFPPAVNHIARASLGAVAIIAGIALWLGYNTQASPYVTRQGVTREQPVPFSHEHHVKGLGVDCRYCHTSVESSSFAGLPPTYTCMSCHSQIWATSPMLEPVRTSLAEKKPLNWT